jgi:hypothetical protein
MRSHVTNKVHVKQIKNIQVYLGLKYYWLERNISKNSVLVFMIS